ncbi:Dihydropyrimidinase [Tetrabaena socialis]|uniref:dihydropyrimidinase n=1 Tax=Tetrabaena socialis TaxID=47790 RepID=A0A2J7ZW81_9CHLO|nr:Dihydropyrimidinase [Tetrabaena socialis]|eukprot:PNH04524.1 Dihydropyrimidinase [Tetrabaena socialis]
MHQRFPVSQARVLALVLLLARAYGKEGGAGGIILVKGGTVVNHDQQMLADVLIRGGLIAEVAPGIEALASGVLQKAAGRNDFRKIPNGVNGIEERMHVTWQEMVVSGLSTPSDFVRMTSTAAAQTFNLYPRKGRVAVGSDADIAVLDPRVNHTLGVGAHHSRVDVNVYEGRVVQGKVVSTISRGRLVWHQGRLRVEAGSGRFVPRRPHGPLFQGLDEQRRRAMTFPYGPTPVARDGGGGSGGDEAAAAEQQACSAAGVL